MTEMTTKDQAIARLPTGPWSKESEMLESWIANKPAPDCRTCERHYPEVDGAYGGYTNRCNTPCTNGDQYQPAPTVVLWRTE